MRGKFMLDKVELDATSFFKEKLVADFLKKFKRSYENYFNALRINSLWSERIISMYKR